MCPPYFPVMAHVNGPPISEEEKENARNNPSINNATSVDPSLVQSIDDIVVAEDRNAWPPGYVRR